MMKTMRYILLWMVLANSMVLFAKTDAKDESGAIDRKRMAAFKEYVVNYTLLQNLPLYVERNSCDGAAIIMHNLVKENVFVYTDTEEHDVPCRLLLQLNKNVLIDLTDLHLRLLKSPREPFYSAAFFKTLPYIVELRAKAGDEKVGELETCFNALYGVLLLRLQKKEIKPDTLKAIQQISSFLSLLAEKHKQDKAGELKLEDD